MRLTNEASFQSGLSVLKVKVPFLVLLLYIKGQRTALILRDVSAATLECKESNCCPKFGVCVSVRLCTACVFVHIHSFLCSERERDTDYG